MSNETNETIEDIVAEMREGVVADGWMEQTLREFADRVEAAHKREIADEKRISDAVIQSLRDKKLEMAGEIAAHKRETSDLRCRLKVVEDALGESRIAICHICNMKHTCGHGTAKFDPCCIIKDIDSAIAAIRGVGGAE